MSLVIDFHVHVVPDKIGEYMPEMGKLPLALFRSRARQWMRPFSRAAHSLQTLVRVFPDPIRRPVDQLTGLATIPGLLFEATPTDLAASMEDAEIQKALVIAYPPYASNDYVLEICAENQNLIPVVNISSGTAKPGEALKEYVERGARALKLHPAADGEGVDSPRYQALLKSASDLAIPIILHTGCFHTHVFFKDPDQGHAQRFAPWFKEYPKTQFILAHMNFHEPNIALDLAEEHENIWVDTSWQPSEIIGEAARRIGSERILFGSDWPVIGNNQRIGIQRVRECIQMGVLTDIDVNRILGLNAARLLGIKNAT